MAVLLGYVMLFGSVAPGVAGAIFVVFVVKARIDAFKLCNVYQRVMPARLPPDGIGAWGGVIRGLAEIGRATSVAIPLFNLGYFKKSGDEDSFLRMLGAGPDGLTWIQKTVIWFVIKELLERIGDLIGFFIPDASTETQNMQAKRQKATKRLRALLASRQIDDESGPQADVVYQRAGNQRLSTFGVTHLGKLDESASIWELVDREDFGRPFEMETYFGPPSSG